MGKVSLFQDSHFVGYVSHVSPTYTRIHFPASNLLTKFYYNGVTLQAGLVGSYLLIEGENYGFLAQVIEIVLPEKERLGLTQASFESEHFHPIARVEILLGFDYYEPFKAQKGLNQLPPVGSKAYVCQTSILDRFLQEFGKDNSKNPTEPSFEIAQLPNDNNSSVKISPQALFSRHCAIVGTTGGGKSYTVAKILEEVSKNNGKAIVIDATGEYAPLAKLPNSTYLKFNSGDTEEVYFHYSGLRETDLYALFKPSPQSQLPKFQEACKSQRLLYNGKELPQGLIHQERVIRKAGFKILDYLKLEKEYAEFLNSPNCRFNIKNLAVQIVYECIHPTGYIDSKKRNDPEEAKKEELFGDKNEKEIGYCNSLISRINVILQNQSFIKAFGIDKDEPCDNNFTKIIEEFIGSNSKTLILSVENVTSDNDLKSILVNAIGRHLYEKALSKDKPFKEKPLLLFVDEAHQFLNKKVKDEYSIETELNAFEKIAKECRKQGLFLVLATQMPRDIPVGVLSQFGTFIVHRLINQRDRETIEYACSEATKNALSFLPILAPGEAILAGVDFPMPIMLKIRKPNFTPDSDTPVLFKSPMTTKKKIFFALLVLVLLGLGYIANYAYRYALIGAGYNAKAICSCVYVSGRSLESVVAEDLYAIPFGTKTIDTVAKTATATIFGIASKTAIYRPKLGCTLVNEVTVEALRQQPRITAINHPTEVLTDSVLSPSQQDAIKKTLDWAFAEPDPKHPIRTRAVVVLHKGKVVTERYAKGITPNTALTGWSMTKSVTNAIIGMLVKEGKLDVNQPAPVAEWANDNRKEITLDNLLRMSSGLKFAEVYDAISDATKMLFSVAGAGKYAIQSPVEVPPATKWYYSSGTTNILQEITRRQFKTHAEYLNFPHQRLFQKLGMNTAQLEPDPSGTYVGSSFMYASARDWAKFGQLYAQDGLWKGERLLPEGWVQYSSRETPHSEGRYAAQFWTYVRKTGLPADSFTMNGFEGQFVLIIPSKQLVVVRLGCSPEEKYFDEVKFFKEIAANF